jgi:hypothetical protein
MLLTGDPMVLVCLLRVTMVVALVAGEQCIAV